MTEDDVIRMAVKCQLLNTNNRDGVYAQALCEFAKLVAEHERQRLHDKFMAIHDSQKHSNNYFHFAARQIKENT